MREIALLLVLANLGFLAWGLWIAPEEQGPVAAAATVEKVPRLVLASEVTPAPPDEAQSVSAGEAGVDAVGTAGGGQGVSSAPASATAEEGAGSPAVEGAAVPNSVGGRSLDAAPDTQGTETEPPPATAGLITQDVPADGRPTSAAALTPLPSVSRVALTAATPAPHCVSLGPFLDLAETAEAAARLRERGHMPSQRLADSPLWVGYWVHLAPFPTRDEAVAAVEKLRGGGVEDLYVEPSGQDENAVSLGLYSDRGRADALATTIRSLGYAPQVTDKYRVASVYWVDVVLPPRVTLNPANYAVRSGRAVRADEHECPEGTTMPGVVADARGEE